MWRWLVGYEGILIWEVVGFDVWSFVVEYLFGGFDVIWDDFVVCLCVVVVDCLYCMDSVVGFDVCVV